MAHDIKVVFGKRVREFRTKQGYSQEGFAEHCGLHWTYLSGIERGKHIPRIDIALKIASGLGITMSTLFRDFERLVKRRRG